MIQENEPQPHQELKIIRSRENLIYQKLRKLSKSPKARQQVNQTLLEGVHLISEYLAFVGYPRLIVASVSAIATHEIKNVISGSNTETVLFPDNLFNSISLVDNPTGILALIDVPQSNSILSNRAACVILEDIQDPGNVGSILRSAAGSGLMQIYASPKCVDIWSPKVLRAGMGAHFKLEIHTKVDTQQLIQGFEENVFATVLTGGVPLYDVDLSGAMAFVFGNEGAGLSPELLAGVTKKISIPMAGKTESLNVAAAAAVCFFERARQLRLVS